MPGKLNYGEFFFSTRWQPSSDVRPTYGIAALMVGTVCVTVLAMAIAMPLGLGAAVFISVLRRQAQGNPQNPDRTAGRRSVDRLGVCRLYGAESVDYQRDRRGRRRKHAQRRHHPGG